MGRFLIFTHLRHCTCLHIIDCTNSKILQLIVNKAPFYSLQQPAECSQTILMKSSFWASTNSPARGQLIMLKDTPQQLMTPLEPRQLHAYCCTIHKNWWFIWTMCLSCWALTAQACQWHLCCAHNRKPANLSPNVHGFWKLSIVCLDDTHP